MKKGTNPELIEMFNNGLSSLRASGQYQEIIDKYLASKLNPQRNQRQKAQCLVS